MKKLLALVLALVMTLSLCVVSGNAAYPDAADVDYEEAVDVMTALGVFKGDEKGNFLPDANLTREAAAKLVAYLDLGEKVAEALPEVKVFSDVEANRWSSKYIAYCADAGYIAGVGDGSFNPTGDLTGYAFGKLLLCALGYDATIEQFTGANWSIAVAKLMQSNDIAKGVDKAGSAVLTREEAAQFCLNALKADCVEYDDIGTTITTGDVTIVTGASKAEPVWNDYDEDYRYEDPNGDCDDIEQLIEKLFPDVSLYETDEHDAYGRPAITWYDEDEDEVIGTYGETADYTFVIDKVTDIEELVEDENLRKIDDLNDFDDMPLLPGFTVELFVDKHGTLTDVALYCYTAVEITDVRELDEGDADDKDAVKDGATYALEIADTGEEIYDIMIANFDAKTYVKGAVVIVPIVNGPFPVAAEWKEFDELGELPVIVDTTIAKPFDGKFTAIGGLSSGFPEYIRIDGTKYSVSAGIELFLELSEVDEIPDIGTKGTFYTDPNGFLVGFTAEDEDTVAAIEDVLVAVDAYKVTEKDKYGTETTTYYVQAVGVDGEVYELPVAKVEGNNAIDVNPDSDIEADGDVYVPVYDVFTAKELKKGDYKGTFEIEAYDCEINDDYYWEEVNVSELEADDKKLPNEDWCRLNNKTTYISIEDGKADIEVSVKTGGVTVKDDPYAIAIYSEPSTNNFLAAYVFLFDAELKSSTKSNEIVYVDETLAEDTMEFIVIGEDEDIDAVTFDVYTLGGKTKTITVLDDDMGDLAPGYFYEITEIEDDGNYILDDADIEAYEVDEQTGVAYDVEYAGWDDEDTIFTALGDIDTSKAVFVDVHDQDDPDEYGRTVKTIAAMDKAYDAGYGIIMNIYGDEDDGAVIIFITSVYAN